MERHTLRPVQRHMLFVNFHIMQTYNLYFNEGLHSHLEHELDENSVLQNGIINELGSVDLDPKHSHFPRLCHKNGC